MESRKVTFLCSRTVSSGTVLRCYDWATKMAVSRSFIAAASGTSSLVGGVPTSQHTKGEAADCYCASGPEYLLQVLLDSGLPFDQAIVYKRKRFLHLSYRQGRCRKMVLYK